MSIANELITRGWTQGHAMDDMGRVCLVEAGALAEGGAGHVYSKTLRILKKLVNGSVAKWNDAPERTFDEVLRVARQADEILDEQR